MDDIFSLDSLRLIKQQSAPGTPKSIHQHLCELSDFCTGWLSVKNTQKSQRLISVFCCWLLWCLGSTRLSHSHFYGRKTSQANSRSTIHTHRQADLWKSVSRILAIFCQNILMKKLSWAKSMFDWLVAVLFHKLCTRYLLTQPDHMHIFWSQRIKSLCLGCWALNNMS